MPGNRTNTLVVGTPEGIHFSLPLAGVFSRFLAWIIDTLLIGALSIFAARLLASLAPLLGELSAAVTVLLYFVISIGYAIALEWLWRGQTLGKRLLGLRVMDEQGLRLQFSQVVVRNLLRFVDGLPATYLVGGLACFFSRKAQRLGDYAANTIVVRTRESLEPDIDQVLPSKYNSFREHPHLAARLRQRVTPQAARIAVQALRRRNEIAPEERVKLFADLAGHLRSLVAFPEEASLGLPDEQYVRNVLDIVYRNKAG